MSVRSWLMDRDAGYVATRRAARTAIVMPALFALGFEVIGNPAIATFAAFGSFAMLLLADFGGSLAERLAAQAGLVAAGTALVCLATLASRTAWGAALAMLAAGFVVLFAGVVSSVLAGASTAVLLSFILPVTTPAGPQAIPDRVSGWVLAGLVSLPAVTLLWPAPRREPLREAAAEACRALSARLSAEVAQRDAEAERTDVAAALARSDTAVAALRSRFLATPYRPSGLSTGARAVVRLVDEVLFLDVLLADAATMRSGARLNPSVRAAKAATAVLLDHAGKSLGRADPPQDSLQAHLDDLVRAREDMERAAADGVVLPPADRASELTGSLRPSSRAHQLSFVAAAIATNVEIAVAADERGWREKLLGRGPEGLVSPVTSARQRAVSHLDPHSVWLHNSVRGALALSAAVLVANLSGAQHSFWIVLGALSVLRSNALNTGQNAVRGLAGTASGFAVGGAVVLVVGTDTTVLWALLPAAILLAGISPAVSFAVGQAGFTVALLILFNIITPAGWQVGLVRIEDVAIGCGVSIVVGALFWPRGAAAALRRALSEAYAGAAGYLRAAAESGAENLGTRSPSDAAAVRSAGAARRLDDTFREFLAERGSKRLSLAQVSVLLTGVAALRLTADAVVVLWRPDEDVAVPTPRADLELIASTERVTNWYAATALALVAGGALPQPLQPDDHAQSRLVQALHADLSASPATDPAISRRTLRLIWTSDHVEAARRLQAAIAQPARVAAGVPQGRPGDETPRSEPLAAAATASGSHDDVG